MCSSKHLDRTRSGPGSEQSRVNSIKELTDSAVSLLNCLPSSFVFIMFIV